jgi:hypothetical protein
LWIRCGEEAIPKTSVSYRGLYSIANIPFVWVYVEKNVNPGVESVI